MEPGTAEPYVCEPIDLTNFRGFLVLMSDGLYEAYEAWTRRPSMVNQDIAHLIAKELKHTADISIVAQNVVEKVKNLFRTTCQKDQRSGRLDDITLIVRNFGFPMGIAHAVSHPPEGPLHPRPGYMQSMSVQPSYSNYPHLPQNYIPAPMSTRPIAGMSQYPTNAQAPPMGQYYSGGPATMPYQQTVHFIDPVQSVPISGAPYNQPDYNSSSGAYAGYGNTSIPTSTGYSATGGYQDSYMQQPGITPQSSHPPLHPTKSEPTFQQQSALDKKRQSLPATTPRTVHEYENTKVDSKTLPNPRRRLQVDRNDPSQYVNVRPNEPGLTPSRPERHLNRLSDSAIDEKRMDDSLKGTNASQDYPPPPPVTPQAEVKFSTPLSQTPPMRPKSADASQMSAEDNPDSPVVNSQLIKVQKQKSIEKRSSTQEEFDLYGWRANGDSSQPSTLTSTSSQPSTLTLQPENENQNPNSEPVPEREEKEKSPPTPRQQQVQHEEDPKDDRTDLKEESDDEIGVHTADLSDYSEVSEGEEDLLDSGGCLIPYVKNWAGLPNDLSWDNVPVDV